MRSKGFTLIELLAVIVILAIISLIAVPIVLNIINNSKESAQLRSAEMYTKAVQQAVVRENMKGEFSPKECILSNDVLTCDGKELTVEIDGETPTNAKITFDNDKISSVSLKYSNNKTVVRNNEGKLVYGESEMILEEGVSICTPATVQPYASTAPNPTDPGYAYECKVKEVMESEYPNGYTFYVLSSNLDGTTNLIMNQNINSDGTLAGMVGITKATDENRYNMISWQSSKQSVDGPVTAMQFLYNATKDWSNVPPLNYTYNDKEFQGNEAYGYESFVSINGVGKINEVQFTSGQLLRARMPIYSSDVTKTEVSDKTDATAFLYENIDEWQSLNGYWTLTSSISYTNHALGVRSSSWRGEYYNTVNSLGVWHMEVYGVRPVITVEL